MRHAWIVGCLLFLAACSDKVTDSAVALTVKYPGYTPLCLRVTAVDAADSERRSDELITQSKLATDDDRTLILAVYREKSWSQELRVEVASYATPDCTGTAIETRQVASAVTLPAKGSVPAALELLAQDFDKDGHAARAPGDDAIQGTDCDDRRDAVHPGATAVCDGRDNLETDFDCDGTLDCNGGGCTSDAMCGSGFCVAGICCDSACDEPASQCRGAGTCGTGTCVYPVTTGAACDDGSQCTSGDTCGADGTCAGTAKTCGPGPGQCYAEAGTCNASTGDCEYPPLPTTAACDDGLQCTVDDRCNGSGGCGGTAKVCNTPPNTCREGTGTCQEPTGDCEYALRPVSSVCDDGSQCTLDDRCDGSGTCAGTAKTCDGPPGQCHADLGTCDPASGVCSYEPKPPSAVCDDGKDCTTSDSCNGEGVCNGTVNCSPPTECQKALEVCTADGMCQFTADPAQEGKVCLQGGNAGTCDAAGVCQPLRFDYAVTGNFDPVAIAANPIGDLDITCEATFDSSGTPSWTFAPDCSVTPPTPTHVVTGDDFVVIAVRHLKVNAALRVVGSRPVILAVYGDATLNHDILAHSARDASNPGAGSGVTCSGRTGGPGGVSGDDGSGGGGGGLATEGGLGGANDDGTAGGPKGGALLTSGFSPLEGGCQGGAGGGITGTTPGVGGPGGGALQVSVAGTLTLGSVVSVSGAGGGGGASTVNNAAGGGGGGSGGMLVLEAGTLVVESTARITANGGSGGEGSDAQSGSQSPGTPGADGSTQNDTPVAGGDGTAANGGAGGAGAAGSTNPGDGLDGTGSGGTHGAGGGGGGAAGRILLRGVTSCTSIPAGAIISPAAVSSCPP